MRRLITILLALSALSCSWSMCHVSATSGSESLTAKDHIEIFETIWKTIQEDYYDASFNGVDWTAVRERYQPLIEITKTDVEFYVLIKQMVRELHDLHTGFAGPDDQSLDTGLAVNEVEGQVAVIRVEPGSNAAKAGVEPGMIVRRVNGRTAEERIAQLRAALGHSSSPQADHFVIFNSFLTGPLEQPLKLDLGRAKGSTFEVVLARSIRPKAIPTLTSQQLSSGIQYLKVNAFRSPVDDEFKKAFANFKDAPGLIIDVRGCTGGDIHGIGLKIADYFFSTKVSFGRFINRAGETPPFRSLSAEGGSQIYKGKVVILIDEGTRSAGEVFANGFQENGRAMIVGQRSAGAVADTDTKKVKGGGVLQYSHLGYISGKGKKLEGAGVVPDKTMVITLADVRSGRDAMLETAKSILTMK